MRQVQHDELVWTLTFQLRRLRPAVIKMLASPDAAIRHRGADVIANLLAEKSLKRLEILTDAPPPPPFGHGGASVAEGELDELFPVGEA